MRKWFLTWFIIPAIVGNTQVIKRIDGSLVTADSLQRKIESLMMHANVSGVAISVFNKNQPVFTKTFGLADVSKQRELQPESIMYAASFAKSVFAYIVMQMVQEKIIELDKPLYLYLQKPLPEYVFQKSNRGYLDIKEDERYKKITARMCLTHTTGFPNWRWFEADRKLKIKFEPGTRYSYSGEGLFLLQFVIEQITGKDLETMAQERVFKKLGMSNTSYVWQKSFNHDIVYGHNAAGVPYELQRRKEANASGSMSTSLNDFTTFFTALINCKGLRKKSFRQMTAPQVRIRSQKQFGPLALVDNTDNDDIALSYGLGFGVIKTPYGKAFFKEGHDDGWGHYSIAFPDKKIAVIIMTNNDNGESILKELLEYAIGDRYTPWQWENYIPYNSQVSKPVE